jgi:hypothetical protein
VAVVRGRRGSIHVWLRRRHVDGSFTSRDTEWTSCAPRRAGGGHGGKTYGVTIRPGRRTLRSNSSPEAEHQHGKRDGHSLRRRHSPRFLRSTTPPPTPPGRSPHHAVTSSKPSMYATHPPPAAGQTPPPQTASNKPIPDGTHCPPQAIKGPLQATPKAQCFELGPPKSFWEKQKSAVASAGQPHAEEAPAKELRDPSWRHRNACAWRSDMLSALHQIYRGEASAGFAALPRAIRGFLQTI